ncbi:MAG: hypothetical protein ACLTOJ_15970, partial [[Clostridium] symbiosum]
YIPYQNGCFAYAFLRGRKDAHPYIENVWGHGGLNFPVFQVLNDGFWLGSFFCKNGSMRIAEIIAVK